MEVSDLTCEVQFASMTHPPRARDLIKGAMKTHGFSYKLLAAALARQGVQLSPKSLSTKINRGAFSADFLVECLRAMEVGVLSVPPARKPRR